MHAHTGGYRSRFSRAGFLCLVLCVWGAVLLFLIPNDVEASDKIIVGAVEDVILLPWGVKVPARIDTGAATSSLDVCTFAVEDSFVTFTLADRCGGYQVRLPLVEMRRIQSTEGDEMRPVVEMEICLGSRRLRSQVTLNDRSRLEFPFLVGRNIIEGKFVVDVSRSRMIPPACPKGTSP